MSKPRSDRTSTSPTECGRDILVVDDNETNLVAIEAALESVGRKLVCARSGNEALGKLLDQDFALILLDVAMPGIDGFETARLMRSRERNRTTPIIFITGVAWHDDAMLRGYDLGAFDYMVKPIKAQVLKAKAQVFVDLQDRTAELRQAHAEAFQRELEVQRRALETAAMERQVKELIEADRKKDELLGILAHELRRPLQPLLSVVEIVDDSPDTPPSDRTRQVLRRHVHEMKQLIDDLTDVTRLTASELQLRKELVAIDDVVDRAVAQCRTLVDGRMHEVTVHRAGDAGIVDGDATRLVQVVSNLITNAARYTPSGGTIEVRAAVVANHVDVTVTDNGRGIAPEILPKLFDMFVPERVARDGGGGLGLGLGLVKRLVTLHGGSVTGTSAGEGKGSVFVIRLPRARVAAAGTQPPLRALICDDAAEVRELLAELLREHGHQVTTVADGLAALRTILNDKPDVAVIDVSVPGMNGYELARAVRRELDSTQLRLVAMTGLSRPEDRVAALDAGFDSHLAKPASGAEILRSLRSKPS